MTIRYIVWSPRFAAVDLIVNNARITFDKKRPKISNKNWYSLMRAQIRKCQNSLKTFLYLSVKFGKISKLTLLPYTRWAKAIGSSFHHSMPCRIKLTPFSIKSIPVCNKGMVLLATVTCKKVTTKTKFNLAATCIFQFEKNEIREFRHLHESTFEQSKIKGKNLKWIWAKPNATTYVMKMKLIIWPK